MKKMNCKFCSVHGTGPMPHEEQEDGSWKCAFCGTRREEGKK